MFARSHHTEGHVPDVVPHLSTGKHRNPRKGACFMEYVSYLAGERWSDHPECTHPLLAALGRLVNDLTSNDGRGRLVGLVPMVIGLDSDDPRVDAQIALRAATTALPVVAEERQRVLAVSVLSAEEVLDGLDGRSPGTLQERSRWALEQAPHAADWARRLDRRVRTESTVRGFCRHAAPTAVRHATVGIAQACVPDRDALLYDVLRGAIDDCAAMVPGDHGHDHGRVRSGAPVTPTTEAPSSST